MSTRKPKKRVVRKQPVQKTSRKDQRAQEKIRDQVDIKKRDLETNVLLAMLDLDSTNPHRSDAVTYLGLGQKIDTNDMELHAQVFELFAYSHGEKTPRSGKLSIVRVKHAIVKTMNDILGQYTKLFDRLDETMIGPIMQKNNGLEAVFEEVCETQREHIVQAGVGLQKLREKLPGNNPPPDYDVFAEQIAALKYAILKPIKIVDAVERNVPYGLYKKLAKALGSVSLPTAAFIGRQMYGASEPNLKELLTADEWDSRPHDTKIYPFDLQENAEKILLPESELDDIIEFANDLEKLEGGEQVIIALDIMTKDGLEEDEALALLQRLPPGPTTYRKLAKLALQDETLIVPYTSAAAEDHSLLTTTATLVEKGYPIEKAATAIIESAGYMIGSKTFGEVVTQLSPKKKLLPLLTDNLLYLSCGEKVDEAISLALESREGLAFFELYAEAARNERRLTQEALVRHVKEKGAADINEFYTNLVALSQPQRRAALDQDDLDAGILAARRENEAVLKSNGYKSAHAKTIRTYGLSHLMNGLAPDRFTAFEQVAEAVIGTRYEQTLFGNCATRDTFFAQLDEAPDETLANMRDLDEGMSPYLAIQYALAPVSPTDDVDVAPTVDNRVILVSGYDTTHAEAYLRGKGINVRCVSTTTPSKFDVIKPEDIVVCNIGRTGHSESARAEGFAGEGMFRRCRHTNAKRIYECILDVSSKLREPVLEPS